MSKYFVTAFLIIVIGTVLSNAFTTNHQESVIVRPRRDTLEETQEIHINGKDAADGTNQGVIATYWNNFLKRARQPLSNWNITNPIPNIFRPYVVSVDSPPENPKPQPQKYQQQQQTQQQLIGEPQSEQYLILLDPATQQYYKVQPVSS